MNTIEAEIAHFVECVRDGHRPMQTQAEGTDVLKVILGAYRSPAEGSVISLADL